MPFYNGNERKIWNSTRSNSVGRNNSKTIYMKHERWVILLTVKPPPQHITVQNDAVAYQWYGIDDKW